VDFDKDIVSRRSANWVQFRKATPSIRWRDTSKHRRLTGERMERTTWESDYQEL